jgi:pimeloyl-ACP methyl ester carboxylesterase
VTLWTDFLGADVAFVEAGGVRTRIVRLGEGDPVLLLHGRGGHLESWRYTLAAAASTGSAIAVDLLGHGLTGRLDCDYSIPHLVDHVAAVLEQLDVGCADAVGQSLGAWVAAWLAIRSPSRVRSLVLVEPAGLQSEEERLASPEVAQAYVRGGRAFSTPTVEAVRERLEGLVLDPATIDEELVELRRRLYEPEPAREVHRRVRSAPNEVWLLTEDVLARIEAPTLFVHGAHGHVPQAVLERASTALPNGRLSVLAGAKQWPQYERPEAFNALLVQFLRERQAHDVLA